jgi:hypothetical protein
MDPRRARRHALPCKAVLLKARARLCEAVRRAAQGVADVQGPEDLLRKLSDLQTAAAAAAEKMGGLKNEAQHQLSASHVPLSHSLLK